MLNMTYTDLNIRQSQGEPFKKRTFTSFLAFGISRQLKRFKRLMFGVGGVFPLSLSQLFHLLKIVFMLSWLTLRNSNQNEAHEYKDPEPTGALLAHMRLLYS